MHADHYYEIGSSHTACEDYAMSGTQDGLSYAILADGCSSSKDSDVGARVLCHIAKNAMMYLHRQGRLKDEHYVSDLFPSVLREMVVMKAIETRAFLGLPHEAFDATLLAAFCSEGYRRDPAWGYICFGDGVAVLRYPDGGSRVFRAEYESGAPYYLSYNMSKERDLAYRETYDQSRVNTITDFGPDGNKVRRRTNRWEPFTDYTHFMSHDIVIDPPIQIVLFSDGVDSYEHFDEVGNRTPRDCIDVVQEAMLYKSMSGEFVKRRMRAMGKSMAARSFKHYDDVSCAAVHIGKGD